MAHLIESARNARTGGGGAGLIPGFGFVRARESGGVAQQYETGQACFPGDRQRARARTRRVKLQSSQLITASVISGRTFVALPAAYEGRKFRAKLLAPCPGGEGEKKDEGKLREKEREKATTE